MISQRQLRARRMQLAIGVMLFAVGFIILQFRRDIAEAFNFTPILVTWTGISSVAYGAAFFMMLYLRGAIRIRLFDSLISVESDADSPRRVPLTSHAELEPLRTKLLELEARLSTAALPGTVASTEDRDQLVATLRDSIAPSLAKELDERFKHEYQRSEHLAQAREAFDTNSRRLASEIAALFRRGNLNLVIGVLTTVAAAALLYYTTIKAAPSFSDMTALLSYYIPRITTVVFIEVFAFFFLRLYKASLSQAQHYQNELTRSALIEVAFEAATRTQDNAILSSVLRGMTRSNLPIFSDGSGVKSKKNGIAIDAETIKQAVDLVKSVRD